METSLLLEQYKLAICGLSIKLFNLKTKNKK